MLKLKSIRKTYTFVNCRFLEKKLHVHGLRSLHVHGLKRVCNETCITCHYWLLHVYEVYRSFLFLRFKKRKYFRCVPTMWYSLFSIGLLFFLIVDVFMLWKITNEHIFYKFNVNIRFQETCDNDNITTLLYLDFHQNLLYDTRKRTIIAFNVKKDKTDVSNNTHCTGDRIKMVKVVH
jgi:hypothetical protein